MKDFLGHRAEHYRRRGWRLYGVAVPGLREAPAGWEGPLPDLFVQKRGRRRALPIRSASELADSEELHRVQIMMHNPGVEIRVFVFSARALREGRRLRRRIRGFWRRRRVEVILVRRVKRRILEEPRYNLRRFWRFQLAGMLVIALLGGAFLAFVYFSPPLFSGGFRLDSQKGYRPHDIERQMKEMNEAGKRLEERRRPPLAE